MGVSLVALLALVAVGCAGADNGTEADREEVERTLRAYFDAIMTQSARSLDTITTDGFLLVQNGHRIDRGRFSETWLEGQPLETRYRQEGLGEAFQQFEPLWIQFRSGEQKTPLFPRL